MGDKRFSSGPRNRGGKSGANRSSSPDEPAEITPVIPHIKLQDNGNSLPTYAAALSRAPGESVPSEDLDAIQLELETLLSTVAIRHRALKSQLDSIEKGDHKSSVASTSSSSSSSRPSTATTVQASDKPPISPGKRRRTDDNVNTQQQMQQQQQLEKRAKFRESVGKMSSLSMRMGKLKNTAGLSPASQHTTDDSSDAHTFSLSRSKNSSNNHPNSNSSSTSTNQQNAKLVHQSTAPNKFWLSIEPYCMPISQEDLKMLDDLIEEFSGNINTAIPELGPHYGVQWGLEDLADEKDNSNAQVKSATGKKGAQQQHNNATQNGEVMRILRNSKKGMGEGVTGPLTQRLVSALIEENLISDSTNTTTTTSTENSNSSLENMPNNGVMQTRSTVGLLKNGISIERRVRQELIEQGILDDEEDLNSTPPDDEILQEIKRIQSELVGIAKFNTNELLKLQSIANEELKRLEIKRKLDDVDQKVLEMHEKMVANKQTGHKMTKQERDEIFRLTEEQKNLSYKLDQIKVPGFSVELS